jgi:hypothetical protein
VFQRACLNARRAGLAAAMACVLGAAAAHGQPKGDVLTDQSQILARFPDDTALVPHGARVRLRNGHWVEVTDNPLAKSAPVLCWYAPRLHVAGICQMGQGVAVTVLIELNSGHRVTAPGLARLLPERGWIAVGPDEQSGVGSDSVTLVKIERNDLLDEGGAQFDEDYGPGAWVDGDCYRLTPKGGKGAAWLEKTRAGWQEIPATQSAVCQGRHGN